jgi:hypothetical protein
MTGNVTSAEVELTADSPDDIDEVYDGLRGIPGIRVTAIPVPTQPGDQGAALDILMVALSSGAVTAFLQIIKGARRLTRAEVQPEDTPGKNKLEVIADNVDEVLPVIRELIDGQ